MLINMIDAAQNYAVGSWMHSLGIRQINNLVTSLSSILISALVKLIGRYLVPL